MGPIPWVFTGFFQFSEWARSEYFWVAIRTVASSQWGVDKNSTNIVTTCSWPSLSWFSYRIIVDSSPISLASQNFLPARIFLPHCYLRLRVHLFLAFRFYILLSPFQFDHVNLIFCLSDLKLDYSHFFSKTKSFIQEVTSVEFCFSLY